MEKKELLHVDGKEAVVLHECLLAVIENAGIRNAEMLGATASVKAKLENLASVKANMKLMEQRRLQIAAQQQAAKK